MSYKSKRMFMALAFAFGALLLAACDPISEEGCRAGNWYERGLMDGANGEFSNQIARYQDICGQLGIVPDHAAWLAGREAGLRQYCTPLNAERIGQEGLDLNPVCANHRELVVANRRGLTYYEVEYNSYGPYFDDHPGRHYGPRPRGWGGSLFCLFFCD